MEKTTYKGFTIWPAESGKFWVRLPSGQASKVSAASVDEIKNNIDKLG